MAIDRESELRRVAELLSQMTLDQLLIVRACALAYCGPGGTWLGPTGDTNARADSLTDEKD